MSYGVGFRYQVALLSLVCVVACDRKEADSERATSQPSSAMSAAALAPSTRKPGTVVPGVGALGIGAPAPALPAPTEETVRAECLQALQRWVRAQNERDRDAYRALYEGTDFVGLKRVHSGKLQRFDLTSWMKDRMGMFDVPFEVAAEGPQVETWLDTGSHLRPGISRVEFTQRWRSAKYADHGPKALLFWRDPQKGNYHIVFEEMLSSSVGWEDSGAKAACATAPPRDFSQPLPALGLCFENAAEIGKAALSSPQLTAFTRSLMTAGNMNCFKEITFERCGSAEQGWEAAENATFEHPCARRAALIPILESGKLRPEDVLSLSTHLQELLVMEPPDPELITALAKSLKSLPAEQVLLFAEAALSEHDYDSAFERIFELLKPPAALGLARRKGRHEVVAPLSPAKHAWKLQQLHSGGVKLPTDTLTKVIEALLAERQRDALVALTKDQSCEVAMRAADALARLGDDKHLPTWAAVKTEDDGYATVCRLRFDPDTARRDRELAKFFHPTKHAKRYYLHTWVRIFEDETSKEPTAAEKRQLAELQAVVPEGPGEPVEMETRQLSAADTAELLYTGAFDAEQTWPTIAVARFFELDGQVYLEHLAIHYIEDNSCPC